MLYSAGKKRKDETFFSLNLTTFSVAIYYTSKQHMQKHTENYTHTKVRVVRYWKLLDFFLQSRVMS